MGTSYHRRSIRLKGHDYSGPASYFVTLVSHERCRFFGTIVNDHFIPTPLGVHVNACWSSLPLHFPLLELDAFIVMPDHFHGILHLFLPHDFRDSPFINTERSASDITESAHSPSERSVHRHPPSPGKLGTIIRSFKSAVTREAHLMRSDYPDKLWQRGYYESIIASEERLAAARTYIINNPRTHSGRQPISMDV